MLSEADAIEGEIMDTVPKEMEPENDGPIDASDVDVGEEEEEKPAPTIAGGLFQWASKSAAATSAAISKKAEEVNNSEFVQNTRKSTSETLEPVRRASLPYWEKTKEVTAPAWEKTKEVTSSAVTTTKELSATAYEKTKEATISAVDATKTYSAAAYEKTREFGENLGPAVKRTSEAASSGFGLVVDSARKRLSLQHPGAAGQDVGEPGEYPEGSDGMIYMDKQEGVFSEYVGEEAEIAAEGVEESALSSESDPSSEDGPGDAFAASAAAAPRELTPDDPDFKDVVVSESCNL